ncbi:Uncharacterized protein LSUE1_G001039 [Lachnellula suecica]|uniref:Uncharacterized protein n=1 Tax=Lachnellula suecica TaxID=602035 RepID=A0A8T9CCA2_9HELO|nr:Uncharacterized protein LSUE1_G001039 [Lachnellula suecica]
MAFQSIRYFYRFAILIVLLLSASIYYFRESIPYHPLSLSYFQHNTPLPPHAYPGSPQDVKHIQTLSSTSPANGNSWSYSIKPLAYIFPQYYPFEDNDRIHGINFTEWDNVKKVTHNGFGLETIRPHESIGFYNGLAFETRQRQAKYLRDSGFYGVVFHHYWFAGRPVMDHIIKAMLEDGEPDIPFMLSWANEPWSAKWDGEGGGQVLLAQDYEMYEGWRKHFDWLLPFFRHPKYIRSEGKIQFVVYNPTHIGFIGPQMFAAWRQWAIEEGLGGLDIIETRWSEGSASRPTQWDEHPPDAINEFAPHAGGRDIATFSAIKRIARVYHRGTLACWDTTPRHSTDGQAVCLPTCHPKTWQHHIIEMFRKIKSDPNPIGSENFFFVNALNEWGEGNSIEPSAQFGDGYGVAMKTALEITEKEHSWLDVSCDTGKARDAEIKLLLNQTSDVCVLVRTSPDNAEDKIFKLSAMLRSLKAQMSPEWRALVYQADRSEYSTLKRTIVQALDARVRHVKIPQDIKLPDSDVNKTSYLATDWVIQNLTDLDPGCASAKYILITHGSHAYEPQAFDAVLYGEGADVIGLNVESKKQILSHPELQNTSWADRCARLEDRFSSLHSLSTLSSDQFQLPASFINTTRFLHEHHTLTSHHSKPSVTDALIEFITSSTSWSYKPFRASKAHVHINPAYSTCLKTGNFWIGWELRVRTFEI